MLDNKNADFLLEKKLDSLLQIGKMIARPYVAIDVFPRGFVNILYMRIRNLGKTPALNVCIKFDQTFAIRGIPVSEYRIFDNIPVLGPNDNLSFLFGSAVEILNDKDAIKQFSGHVKYADVDGIKYENPFNFDLEIYKDLVLAYDDKFEQNIKSEIERLRTEIQEISAYYKDLRHEKLIKAWKKQQEEMPDIDNEE